MHTRLLLLLAFVLTLTNAQRFTVGGQTSVSVRAAEDFATSSYGNAWDYNEKTDFCYMFSDGWQVGHPYVSNGILTAVSTAAGANIASQWEGVITSLNLDGRVGWPHRIKTHRFNRFSVRMARSVQCGVIQLHHLHTTVPGPGRLGAAVVAACDRDGTTGQYANLGPGNRGDSWSIYKFDLDLVNTAELPWTSSEDVYGIRFHPYMPAGATVQLDWMRITPRGDVSVTLAWSGMGGAVSLSATDGTSTINIYPDDGTDRTTFPDNSQFQWDYGFLPPGTWTVTARAGGTSRQVSVTILPQPVVTVTKPSPEGGASDFAQEVIGDPWDLKNPQDVARNGGGFWSVQNPNFGPDGLRAQHKAGSDPAVVFMDDGGVPSGPAIDPNKYRHLTFTLDYDDTAKIQRWANPSSAGMQWSYGVARILFRLQGTTEWSTMEDIVLVDGGPYTYHYDLASAIDHNPQSVTAAVEEGPIWTAGPIGSFAIRVQEPCHDAPCPVVPSFRLADVQIRTDDKASSSGRYTIRWNAANTGSYRVNIYGESRGDTYAQPNLGGRISVASNLDPSAGSYEWDVTSVPAGRYFIHVEIVSGVTVLARDISATPVALTGRYINTNVAPLAFYPLPSLLRLVDTRAGTSADQALYPAQGVIAGNTARAWKVSGIDYKGMSIPTNAVALTGTIIVTGKAGGAADTTAYVTLYPADTDRPLVATINPTMWLLQGNMFTVTLNGGSMAAYCAAAYNLIIDASGYYAPAAAGGLLFTPITPIRLMDTRASEALYSNLGQVSASNKPNVRVAGITYKTSTIPANAQAVSGSFTVVPGAAGGYLTVWPGPSINGMPLASVVNWSPNINAEQSSISKVGSDGTVNFFASTSADVIWDADGYYSADGQLGYVPLASPVRFLDTRPEAAYNSGQGSFKPGDTRTYKIAGFEYNGMGVPDNARGIVGTLANVQSVGPSSGYVTIWPGTDPQPFIAQLQVLPQCFAVGNAITVGLGTDGTVKIFTIAETHMILDVVGYFVPMAAVGRLDNNATNSNAVVSAHSRSKAVVPVVVIAVVLAVVLVAVAVLMVMQYRRTDPAQYENMKL